MKLIDTHAHLYSEKFSEDIDEVIARAKSNNVERILLPNIDEESIGQMNDLLAKDPELFIPMMGLHPCYVTKDFEQTLSKMKLLFEHKKFCAVGEIGIDLYWDKTLEEEQKKAFAIQIGWAKEMKLPIAIHARDSFEQIFEVMDAENAYEIEGVFHCFTGDEKQAEKCLSYGFYLGIGGVVTFKNSNVGEVLKQVVPLDKLLVETDAPYLAPTPHRGKRNESSFVLNVAEKLQDVYEVSVDKIADITTSNASKLFNLNL